MPARGGKFVCPAKFCTAVMLGALVCPNVHVANRHNNPTRKNDLESIGWYESQDNLAGGSGVCQMRKLSRAGYPSEEQHGNPLGWLFDFPSSPLTTVKNRLPFICQKAHATDWFSSGRTRLPRPAIPTPYFTQMLATDCVDASPIVITTVTFPGFAAVGTIAFTWNTPEFNPGAAPA